MVSRLFVSNACTVTVCDEEGTTRVTVGVTEGGVLGGLSSMRREHSRQGCLYMFGGGLAVHCESLPETVHTVYCAKAQL